MQQSTDQELWRHATDSRSILVSKDEDFATLSAMDPGGPPVVWVRSGNTTRKAILSTFEAVLPDLETKLALGERLIEVY